MKLMGKKRKKKDKKVDSKREREKKRKTRTNRCNRKWMTDKKWCVFLFWGEIFSQHQEILGTKALKIERKRDWYRPPNHNVVCFLVVIRNGKKGWRKKKLASYYTNAVSHFSFDENLNAILSRLPPLTDNKYDELELMLE